MVKFRPQRLRSVREFGHPIKFQRLSRLGFVTAAMSFTGGQPNFARCLAGSWADTHIYIFGGSCPWRNFATCKIHFAFQIAFRRGLHLYSAGRPSCWASAHILVVPSTRRITLGDRAFPVPRRESGTQCQQRSERHRRIWRRDLQTFLFKTSFDGWRQWHMHYSNAECDYWIILWRAPAAS